MSRFRLYAPFQIVGLVRALPCSVCSDPGPHAFRIQAAHGFESICQGCAQTEAAVDPLKNVANPLHLSTSNRG